MYEKPEIIGRLAHLDTLLAAQAEIDDFEFEGDTLAGAAASGDVQKMTRIHTAMGCRLCSSDVNAFSWAARGGSVEAMKWLKQHGSEQFITQGMYAIHATAAYNGHLNVLQYLEAEGMMMPDSLDRYDMKAPCEFAALRGDLEILRLLRKHGWLWYDDVCGEAAKGGSVPMLVYLKQQGHVFGEQTMTSAARAGHLSVCQHLRKEGCPWSASACTAAASRAECFATLRWLHESGCPWDIEAVSVAAAESGSTDVIQYVWQQGARPTADLLTKMLVKACVNDQFATAKWLRDRGAKWPAAMTAGV
jgi:hypothetical protein